MGKMIFVIVLILITAGIVLYREAIIGGYAQKPIEEKLTKMFGAEVTLEGLLIDPISGKVTLQYFGIENPQGFSEGSLLEIQGLQGVLNLFALINRKVLIRNVDVVSPEFLFEKIADRETKKSNLATLLENRKKSRKSRKGKSVEGAPTRKNPWIIQLKTIRIQDGVFVFNDTTDEIKGKHMFQKLDAVLKDFNIPAKSNELENSLEIKGAYGEGYPVNFDLRGNANFFSKPLGLDVQLDSEEANLLDFPRLVSAIPFKVVEGNLKISSAAKIKDEQLDVQNTLLFRKLKVGVKREGISSLIVGTTAMAAVKFIESQETIELNIPITGDLNNPKFNLTVVASKAVKDAFLGFIKKGLDVKEVGAKLMEKSTAIVEAGKVKVMEGGPQAVKVATKDIKEIAGRASMKLSNAFKRAAEEFEAKKNLLTSNET